MPRSALSLAVLGLYALSSPPLPADVENDIPLGIEAVAGIRSNYVYRGFDLADTLSDFQLESEIAIAKNLFLKPERTISRKLQEVALALWLEARLSKREILELYFRGRFIDNPDHPTLRALRGEV